MTRVPVELTYENALGDSRVAQIIQSMAAEAGFDIKLSPLGDHLGDRPLPQRQFRSLYRQLERPRRHPDPTLIAFFSCARLAERQQVAATRSSTRS